ncbi:hypothetical protein TH61_06210 [Rufibacter sp. DG15C]|uniref:hypothetical protein n=1 Tax=Rufibacter sp. DG15C TaxID=1379909 RepID=UPI00078C417C|nr:hypothetical protein [Rufibacter sp. DG15C]AMM50858.1 hypothetical protein TH61_06210 [Rufibacter sp. DG15C]
MRRLILSSLALILLISCNQDRNSDFKIPSEKNVQAIVLAVIKQDSLPVISGKSPHYPVSSETQSYRLSFLESNMPPTMPGLGIRLRDLLSVKTDSTGDELLFSKTDTAYFRFLDTKWSSRPYVIQRLRSQGIFFKAKQTLFDELWKTRQAEKSFYVFSNPIVSEDQSRAYIEVAFACDRLCGYGHAYSLLKKKGKWRVTNEVITYFE